MELASLQIADLDLAGWYAEPLDGRAAHVLLASAQRLRQAALSRGEPSALCPLQELIALFWLDRPVEPRYRTFVRTTADPRLSGFAELLMGQLLVSRKLDGAIGYLGRGFHRLAHSLAPAQYFELLRRHELLAELPLSTTAAPAAGLEDLLREAAVIRQLRAGCRLPVPAYPGDTLG